MTPGPAGPSLQHCGHPHQHLTPAGSEASVLGEGEDPVPKRPTSAFQRASLFLVQVFCSVLERTRGQSPPPTLHDTPSVAAPFP